MCFAGSCYRVGSRFRRRQVQVAVVGDTVEISVGEELIPTHPLRHDRAREYDALANPGGADPTASTPPDRLPLTLTLAGEGTGLA
jgi:hypothetical protein